MIPSISPQDEAGGHPAGGKLERLNRLYAVASAINEAIVRMHEPQELYEQACRIAVERGGLVMAWVGLVDARTLVLTPVARWGRDEGYLEAIRVTATADRPEGLGPAGQAFRNGVPACCNDIAAAMETFASRAEALQRGYRSCAAFPLRLEGRSMGVLAVYGDQAGYFAGEELQVLNALAENISFAVESHEREQQRVRAEEALRASEGRYRTLFEYAPDGILIADLDGQYLDANASALRMFGYERDEFVGLSAADIVVPEEIPQIGPALEIIKEANDYHREWQFRRKDGSVFAAEVFAKMMPDGHLVAMIRDITERQQADAALRLSEERFRLLSKATNDAIWDWDISAERLWWNEGFETLFGYRREEVEPTIDSWYRRIHPEDREAIMADFHRAIEAGEESWSGEYRFLCKDGAPAYVLDRGHIIRDVTGRAVRMIGGMTDLTARKQVEEKLREQAALLDKAQDAIVVRDLEHGILYWNRSAERLYGWTATEVLGGSIQKLLYAEPSAFLEATATVMKEGEWIGEIEQVTKGGEKRTIEGRWTLVRDDAGRPKAILAINTDLTERKKLEQQFLRAQRMESIGTLAGGIAHDLNNSLGPILMSIEVLKMKLTDPASRELLAIISSSAQRGADMVSQVLSFARGVEGRRMEVQIRHLIKEIEKIVTDTFHKHIQVRTSVSHELWPVVGDPTQLHQVLLNLCINARDAMPNGGVLTIAAENLQIDAHYATLDLEARPGPYVLVRVEDTGTGIPAALIEKIFDPFFTTKETGKGTGLGLSTSLAIVRSHGGFLRVTSEVGKGAKFAIHLPAQPEPVSDEAGPLATELPRGNGELILVVDDEVSVRQITRQTLEAFGYRVLVAADGAEAVAIFACEGEQIAAVFTDMMMPVMDGPALIQVLLRMNPRVPIIAASGLSTSGPEIYVANLGVKHFLPKPYTAEMLLKALKEVISARS